MDKDTKLTYITIVVLIAILGSVAYFLQENMSVSQEALKNEVAITSEKKEATQPTNTKGSTISTTTTMQPSEKITHAIITTNKGVIEVSFATSTPITVKNFVTLAQAKFYEGVRFHRVIKNFMIQAGDPLSKSVDNVASWGQGGPGYKFQDELTGKETYELGTLAMANAGPNTNGSQFFIVTANPSVQLPPNYTVFGKVTKGLDVVMKIQEVKTTGSASLPNDKPLEDIIIQKIEVAE
jgi:cyclophilin family peptidyl-prolyl cis-trans isomerase